METETTPGPAPMAPAAWLTALQVAPLLGVTPQTVYRLAHSLELPSTLIGTRYRFRPADVDDYITARKVTGPPPPRRPVTAGRP